MVAPSKQEKAKKAKEDEVKKAAAAAEADANNERLKAAAKIVVPPKVQLLQDLRDSIRALDKAVSRRDDRVLISTAKHNARIRSEITPSILRAIADEFLAADSKLYNSLILSISGMEDQSGMTDQEPSEAAASNAKALKEAISKGTPKTSSPIPEVEVYIHLLFVAFVLDNCSLEKALSSSAALIDRIRGINRRSLDRLSAKAYHFWALCNELSGKSKQVLSTLIAAHRSSCLRHDEPGQAMLSNLIIRTYILENLYAQADKFRLNITFPESRSNYQTARYLYYLGKINSVQLHYSDAFTNLSAALRKAPTKAAVGFRQSATKLLIVVQLLMGDIPERTMFFEPTLKRSLKPYFQLTQAVRIGDLAEFSAVQAAHAVLFKRDGVLNLITRLRFNVIKTGLRKISLSYSRISIADISEKLKLGSIEDAEYIIAKAIHDGVIDAQIDRQKGFIYSTDNIDVYSTNEPQAQFHRRIEFCLDMYNSAVMSMRYPDVSPEDPEGAERAAEHDQILEALDDMMEEDMED